MSKNLHKELKIFLPLITFLLVIPVLSTAISLCPNGQPSMGCNACVVDWWCGDSGACGNDCYWFKPLPPLNEICYGYQCRFCNVDHNKPSCGASISGSICRYNGEPVCNVGGWQCSYSGACSICAGKKTKSCSDSGCPLTGSCVKGSCGAECDSNDDCSSNVCLSDCTCEAPATECNPGETRSCTRCYYGSTPAQYCTGATQTCDSSGNWGSCTGGSCSCVEDRCGVTSCDTGCTPSWSSWTNRGCEAYCGSVEGYCPNGKRCERRYDYCGNYEYRCVNDCSCNHCENGVKDCDEYGVDCGGSDCSECACGVTWGIDATGDCSKQTLWTVGYGSGCNDYEDCNYYCQQDCEYQEYTGWEGEDFGFGYTCICTTDEMFCGTTDCPTDCCNGRFLYDYPNDFTRECSSESCQPTSNDCVATPLDCSQDDNADGDSVQCNCDCNGFDVEESEANGNCDDGNDNDCDNLIDEDDPDCMECTPGESYSESCNYCSASDDWCTGGSQTITCDSSGHWGPPSECTGGTCLCVEGECGVVECQICGNDIIEGTEECESPSTEDNENCPQDATTCDYSIRTYCSRDAFGFCDSSCLCAPDSWDCGVADDTDYCDNCDAHCGDDFCNCGENYLTCPGDNCAICTVEPIEVSVTVIMEEDSAVSLSLLDIDPDPIIGSIAVNFDPPLINPPNKNSIMTITANPYTTSGVYTITIRGVAGDTTKTTEYKLTIP